MKTFWQGDLMVHPWHRPRRKRAASKLYRGSLNEQRYTSSVHFTK